MLALKAIPQVFGRQRPLGRGDDAGGQCGDVACQTLDEAVEFRKPAVPG